MSSLTVATKYSLANLCLHIFTDLKVEIDINMIWFRLVKKCELKFMNSNYEKSLFYASFFNNHNIQNSFISFIIIYSIHILHPNTIDNIHVNLFKKHIKSGLVFTNFYNLQTLKNYIDFIKKIE